MGMTNIERLRKFAVAATPGPWYPDRGHKYLRVRSNCGRFVMERGWPNNSDKDALYIAAASPDVVLALLDRLERAEGALVAIYAEHGHLLPEAALDRTLEVIERAESSPV